MTLRIEPTLHPCSILRRVKSGGQGRSWRYSDERAATGTLSAGWGADGGRPLGPASDGSQTAAYRHAKRSVRSRAATRNMRAFRSADIGELSVGIGLVACCDRTKS